MNKNRYDFKWYLSLEIVAMIPIAFSIVPPLVLPITLWCLCVEENNLIPALIFTSWLIAGIIFIAYMEYKYP